MALVALVYSDGETPERHCAEDDQVNVMRQSFWPSLQRARLPALSLQLLVHLMSRITTVALPVIGRSLTPDAVLHRLVALFREAHPAVSLLDRHECAQQQSHCELITEFAYDTYCALREELCLPRDPLRSFL
mmetsp:Transcript_36991/g.92749  ORF Transcript_36991/g.92749 Transcript_36991/m.92749 type:complete len:132 (+) Transcript_36991:1027-1422(+)